MCRTDSASDKNMLVQFRHMIAELSAKKRKEREGEGERQKCLSAGWWWRCGTSLSPRHFKYFCSVVLLPQGKSLLFLIGRLMSCNEQV